MKQGGSAADAAMATALAQIVLTAGATISYAGILTMVYYDAGQQKDLLAQCLLQHCAGGKRTDDQAAR